MGVGTILESTVWSGCVRLKGRSSTVALQILAVAFMAKILAGRLGSDLGASFGNQLRSRCPALTVIGGQWALK